MSIAPHIENHSVSLKVIATMLAADVSLLPDEALDIAVTGLVSDSRAVKSGDVFFAVNAAAKNGHDYIDSALEKGAVAVCADKNPQWPSAKLYNQVPVLVVDNLQNELSQVAHSFYQRPSEKMMVVGVTGTNGKTSVSWLVGQWLDRLGSKANIIGTLGVGNIASLNYTGYTTPDAIQTQSILHNFVSDDVTHVAMEVSSHGLALKRVAAVDFSVAVFTNLTQDHLDFHGDMASYAAAKSELFSFASLKHAVINADDKYSQVMQQALPAHVQLSRISLQDASAEWFVKEVNYSVNGAVIHFVYQRKNYCITSRFLGEFNVYNLMLAMATIVSLGYAVEDVIAMTDQLSLPPGRMQTIHHKQSKKTVVVDYAHTPDALKNVLITLKPHARKLLCVFGCGGNRDNKKRKVMGEMAETYADKIVVTSDNPRFEDPQAIINDIVEGLSDIADALVITDRRQAIETAIDMAEVDDIVLIAGKGHETYQEVDGQQLLFNDLDVAESYLHADEASC